MSSINGFKRRRRTAFSGRRERLDRPEGPSYRCNGRCSLPAAAVVLIALAFAGPAFAQEAGAKPVPLSELKSAAYGEFQRGNAEAGHRHLETLLAYYRESVGGAQSPAGREQWAAYLYEIAYEYLRSSETRRGLQVVGEAADLGLTPHNETDNGLAPTAGALFRQLRQLDAEEQFDLLHKWTMPTESRQTVRLLATIVPPTVPPEVFARALGERPGKDSFQVAAVGDVSGLFSSAWMLVDAAFAAGRIRSLEQELSPLITKDVPNARFVLNLAQIRQTEGSPPQSLVDDLANWKEAADTGATASAPQDVNLQTLVMAAACAGNKMLASTGEALLRALLPHAYGGESFRMRGFLRVALATAIRNRVADASSSILAGPNLAMWQSGSRMSAQREQIGVVPSRWFAQEEHVLHLAGPGGSLLYFRYPLLGEFEFSVETQDGDGDSEGGLAFGGLEFETWSKGYTFNLYDADVAYRLKRPSSFVPVGPTKFHRLTVKSAAEGYTVLSNGHPLWKDAAGQSSPWLGLRAYRSRRPVFRNLKLTGNPVIPREVDLAAGEALRGWRGGYLDGRLPTPFPDSPPEPDSNYDWFLRDGVIHGMKMTGSDVSAHGLQAWLEYARPLWNGESVSYEFFYQPGETTVHPALGRLAFLMEPDGVRLHWIVPHERRWTCLPEDNTVIEPLNRRGRTLPLVEGDWNKVTASLDGDRLTLTLNEQTIYARKLEPDVARTFGFYRDRSRTSAQIRKVVLRGDWPERLTDEQKNNLLAEADVERTAAERHAVNAIFEDENVAADVLAVRAQAAGLALEQRYDYLAAHVLPGANHPHIRLAGDFSPTEPAPVVANLPVVLPNQPTSQMKQTGEIDGGEIVSPAYDLIDAAQQLGRLDELRRRVVQIPVAGTTIQNQRSHAALLALIEVARGDAAGAATALERLFDLFEQTEEATVAERWPEMLAAARASLFPGTHKIAGELLYAMQDRYFADKFRWQSTSSPGWGAHIVSLVGKHKHLAGREQQAAAFHAPPALRNWSPVGTENHRTRGVGTSKTHWQWDGGQLTKLSGHAEDYLFYRIPLLGNYEVECDVTEDSWKAVQVMAADRWLKLHPNRRAFAVGGYRSVESQIAVDPPRSATQGLARYRVVVRDGLRAIYVNGRKLYEDDTAAALDPWVALRASVTSQGSIQDVRITGAPVIPEEIPLAISPELPGWMEYYERAVGPGGAWQLLDDGFKSAGGIVGTRQSHLEGTFCESLLRYHRPMLEDGTIRYEFFYRPDEAMVHPALDRLAFLLEPDGVRIHWLTDAGYDRTGLDPRNRFNEQKDRRGPALLPLKRGEWNQLRFSLRGDVVEIELNGQLVYERKLEANNQRTFGLFHYCDQSEARVRNIVWRGDWPKKLPPVSEQELSLPDHECLAGLDRLQEVFTHDFAAGGVPAELFEVTGVDPEENVVPQADGLRIAPSVRPNNWTNVRLAYLKPIYGDFDAQLKFSDLQLLFGDRGSASLELNAVDDTGIMIATSRQSAEKLRVRCLSKMVIPLPDGTKRYTSSFHTDESTAGTLRLIRRGATLYSLIAHDDSPNFRYIGSHKLPSSGTPIRLHLQAGAGGNGSADALLKAFSVRSNSSAIEKNFDPKAVAINSYMLGQPVRMQQNFSTGPGDDFAVSDKQEVTQETDGLRLLGRDRSGAQVTCRRGYRGDFGVAANFDVARLPDAGSVELSAAVGGNGERVSVKLSKQGDGYRITSHVAGAGKSRAPEEFGTAESTGVDGLRIVRIQKTVLVLYSESGFFRLLATADISDGDVLPGAIRLTATGTPQAETDILLGSVEIRAAARGDD